jgi:hypothetical protein
VQVSYSEGLANHTGPEPCVGIREDAGEALTGEHIGQPSTKALYFRTPTWLEPRKATWGRDNASACPVRRGRRP